MNARTFVLFLLFFYSIFRFITAATTTHFIFISLHFSRLCNFQCLHTHIEYVTRRMHFYSKMFARFQSKKNRFRNFDSKFSLSIRVDRMASVTVFHIKAPVVIYDKRVVAQLNSLNAEMGFEFLYFAGCCATVKSILFHDKSTSVSHFIKYSNDAKKSVCTA